MSAIRTQVSHECCGNNTTAPDMYARFKCITFQPSYNWNMSVFMEILTSACSEYGKEIVDGFICVISALLYIYVYILYPKVLFWGLHEKKTHTS